MKIHPAVLIALLLAQARAETTIPESFSEAKPVVTVPMFGEIESLHAEYVHRFESAPGFGAGRIALPGFRETAPTLSWNGARFDAPPPQLISLEGAPKAYLPLWGGQITLLQMTNQALRSRMTTRPLTAFESNALPRLIAGAPHVVSDPEPDAADTGTNAALALRILARLNAGPTCAKCHGCPEGTLLGAFSYTLQPRPVSSNAASPAWIATRSR